VNVELGESATAADVVRVVVKWRTEIFRCTRLLRCDKSRSFKVIL
jgi:hypothetical protein